MIMRGDYPNSANTTIANTNNTTAPTITANTPWNITRLTGGYSTTSPTIRQVSKSPIA